MQRSRHSSKRWVGVALAVACSAALWAGALPSNAVSKKPPATKARAATKTSTKSKSVTTVASSQTAVPARGKFVFGAPAEPAGLDPATVTRDITADGLTSAIYDVLMDVPFGKAPRPFLAESLTEAADRRSWNLTVRSGVHFHDGTPLTADAVKINLERQRKSRLNGASMALVKSIDVTGPLTLTLTLDKPYGSMPYLLGGTAGIILSPKAIQENPADKLNREPTDAGTGPYILKDFVAGDHSTVVRNPDYWGDPKPRLDQIIFRLIPDEAARYAALQAGDVQTILTLLPTTVNRARGDDFAIIEPPFAGSAAIFLNNSKPPFDDIRIRRAVLLAVDRPAVSAVFEDPNVGKQGFGLWPKGNPWYLADGDVQPYDRAEARRLVSAYVKETGRDVSFSLLLGNANGVTLDGVRLVARYLQDAGMDVTLTNLPDINQLLLGLFSGQYQSAFWAVGLANDPDATAYPTLYSSSPSNFARYKSAEMDAALDAGRVASDPSTRKAAYNDVQRIFRKDLPFIVSSSGTTNLISIKKVCGLDATGGFNAKTVGLGNC